MTSPQALIAAAAAEDRRVEAAFREVCIELRDAQRRGDRAAAYRLTNRTVDLEDRRRGLLEIIGGAPAAGLCLTCSAPVRVGLAVDGGVSCRDCRRGWRAFRPETSGFVRGRRC